MAELPNKTEAQPLPPKVEGEKQAPPAPKPVDLRVRLQGLQGQLQSERERYWKKEISAIDAQIKPQLVQLKREVEELKKTNHQDIELHKLSKEVTETIDQTDLADNVTNRALEKVGMKNAIAVVGGAMSTLGKGVSDTAEVIWKYTLAPIMDGLGRISEQPRAALAKWLNTAKFPGAQFIAGLVHSGPKQKTAADTKKEQTDADFETLVGLMSSNGITLNAGAEPAKQSLITALDGMLAIYKSKTGDVSMTRDGYVLLIIEKLTNAKKVAVTWPEFTKIARDEINAKAVRISQTVTQPPATNAAPANAAPATTVQPPANS